MRTSGLSKTGRKGSLLNPFNVPFREWEKIFRFLSEGFGAGNPKFEYLNPKQIRNTNDANPKLLQHVLGLHHSRALTEQEIQQVMLGVPQGQASSPNPANGDTDVLRNLVLNWEPGEFAALTSGHKVYFGESFDDVNDALEASPRRLPAILPHKILLLARRTTGGSMKSMPRPPAI